MCVIDDCQVEKVKAFDMCQKHYRRWQRHGNAYTVKISSDARGAASLYDALLIRGFSLEGECVISQASYVKGTGYRVINNGGERRYAHRLVYETWFGKIPDGMDVDHNCHNEAAWRGDCPGGESCLHRSCVNPSHLRVTTRGDNVRSGIGRFNRVKRKVT